MIQLTAFKWAPPFAQGSVRDIRVRWALEEAGLGHDDRLLGIEDTATAEYRARQPFGQVPAFQRALADQLKPFRAAEAKNPELVGGAA